jgi:hypothetical protein
VAPDTESMFAFCAARVSWLSLGIAVEEISWLLGDDEGDWTAVAPVILLPVRVIRTWTGPYFVWTVEPVTVRVVGAADVVFGAEGALLVFAGAADAECDVDALGEEDARFLVVFAGEADVEDECDGEGDGEAITALGDVGAVSPWASAGSVCGLRASSSTTVETVAAPASTNCRSGCLFLMILTALSRTQVSQGHRFHGFQDQNSKDSWCMRRSGTPASRNAA